MSWKSIRLELARTRDYPEGSPAHALLVHLPLDPDGYIEPGALAAAPVKARVRRAWPGQPVATGYVIATKKGWALSYRPGEEDDELVYHLENHPIRAGEYVTLTEPDGTALPFRVVSLTELR